MHQKVVAYLNFVYILSTNDKNIKIVHAKCSVCEVENTPLVDNTFEFPAFDAETP